MSAWKYQLECVDCQADVDMGQRRCPRCNASMQMLERFNELLKRVHEKREADGISPDAVPALVRAGGKR